MEIFEYAFMQRAFIVGILLAAIIPCIGLVIVCKRLSMIGDALSHTSLAGVAAGLLLGLNPVLTAAAACVVAAIGIEAIRRKIPRDFRKCPLLSLCLPGLAWRAFCQVFIKMHAKLSNSFPDLEVLWQSVIGEVVSGNCAVSMAGSAYVSAYVQELF